MEHSRIERMPPRQKIENGREQKTSIVSELKVAELLVAELFATLRDHPVPLAADVLEMNSRDDLAIESDELHHRR